MTASPITKGNMALYHLTCALARAEGEQAETLAEAYVDLTAWVDWFMANAPADTPDSAALKCQAATKTPPAVPQRAADSGARVPSPGTRAAPISRGGP